MQRDAVTLAFIYSDAREWLRRFLKPASANAWAAGRKGGRDIGREMRPEEAQQL